MSRVLSDLNARSRFALEVKGLTKVFKRRRKEPLTAVDSLDLTIEPGSTIGLLGPNGAGKTTAIKCILGLVRPTAGQVLIWGQDPTAHYGRAIQYASAVLEGARNIYWRMTPRENARFFAGLHGLDYSQHRDYIEGLLERFGLQEKADEPVLNLSTGMKQKVAVVCALAKQTRLVFLDEPTLGLDIETSLELRSVLREMAVEGDRAIIISSHDMDVIQDVCERVVIIKDGGVIADDRVDNLLALFRTKAYRLVLSDGLPEAVRQRLAAVVPSMEIGMRGQQTELLFTLDAPDELYQVIDLIREGGSLIDSIAQKEPDLEDAFLRLIRDGDAQ